MSENKRTTIWVSIETRNKLNKLRIIPEEYMDSVINRLIKEHEEKKD